MTKITDSGKIDRRSQRKFAHDDEPPKRRTEEDYADRQLARLLEDKAKEIGQTAGNRAVKLDKLALGEKPLEAPPEPERLGPLQVFSPEHMKMKVNPEDLPPRLFGDLIHAGDMVSLNGPSGVGKSALALYIVNHIIGWRQFNHDRLQTDVKNLSAVYCDFEMSQKVMRLRHSEAWGNVGYLDSQGGWDEETEEAIFQGRMKPPSPMKYLLQFIATGRHHIIVVDSASKLIGNVNDVTLVEQFIAQLKIAVNRVERMFEFRPVLIVMNHTNKGIRGEAAHTDQSKGAGYFIEQMDVALGVRKAREVNQFYLVQMKNSRTREGVFSGVEGNGECLLFERVKISTHDTMDQYGIRLIPGEHFERDNIHHGNQPHTEAKREDISRRIAMYINNLTRSKDKPKNLTIAAVQKRITRSGGLQPDGHKPSVLTIQKNRKAVVNELWAEAKEMLSDEWQQ